METISIPDILLVKCKTIIPHNRGKQIQCNTHYMNATIVPYYLYIICYYSPVKSGCHFNYYLYQLREYLQRELLYPNNATYTILPTDITYYSDCLPRISISFFFQTIIYL